MARAEQSAGDAFERALELTHARYRELGLALVEKLHVPARPFFRQGRYQWAPVGKALPDYGGWLFGGRGVLAEVKTTKQKRLWRYPVDRRHQYDYLVAAAAFGVLCVYIIEWREMGEVRLYRIEDLPDFSQSVERAAGLLVPTKDGWVDWLQVLS